MFDITDNISIHPNTCHSCIYLEATYISSYTISVLCRQTNHCCIGNNSNFKGLFEQSNKLIVKVNNNNYYCKYYRYTHEHRDDFVELDLVWDLGTII